MSGLDAMRKRLMYEGGATQDERIVWHKWKSFQYALFHSYQGEWITYNGESCRCLINPDKLKENYDQKEISIDFKHNMKCGDVFLWDRTNTYWLVYLQRYEEEAYFRAQLRRCDYQIDVNGNKYWIYLRGPVETALIWRQKHQIEFNELNYSILFYVTKNEETLDYFSRLKVIKFDGHNWRVAATDKYSQPGIIEVYIEEYFDNPLEDEIDILEIKYPEDESIPYIDGPQIVYPYDTNLHYSIKNASNGNFILDSKKAKIIESDSDNCIIEILTGKSGDFILEYSQEDNDNIYLNINIKSL